MAYLVNLFSPETYEAFSASARNRSGFPQSQRKTATKVAPGDRFICYMTKLSRWFGVLEVVRGPFEDDAPIFAPENDRYVIRFEVRPIVWLPKRRLALDLQRADWLVEAIQEQFEDKGVPLPEELVVRLSTGPFAPATPDRPHPLLEVLGDSSNFTIHTGVGQASYNRRGVKRVTDSNH